MSMSVLLTHANMEGPVLIKSTAFFATVREVVQDQHARKVKLLQIVFSCTEPSDQYVGLI